MHTLYVHVSWEEQVTTGWDDDVHFY